MITKEFVALILIIAFIICTIIIFLYNNWLRKNSNCIMKEIKDSDFSNSKIDDSDIKIICE